MKTTRPSLHIQLLADCPHCGDIFDLVEDTDLNEDGWLLNEILPDDRWIDAHKSFECEVVCPECGKEIKIKGVDW